MKLFKDAAIIGFALFAMFFGAGNIIFPPYIGLISGTQWMIAFFFYYMADIGLACIAIIALIKSNKIENAEGLMTPLGRIPSLIMMSVIILCIGPLLAIPRTAVISYEMAILPVFSDFPLPVFAAVYFLAVGFFSIRETVLVNRVGLYLTPILVIALLSMIIAGTVNPISETISQPKADNVVWEGVSAGYQTMDTLAALIYGFIIVNAVKTKGYNTNNDKIRAVLIATFVAGILLLIIYGGLCYLGATVSDVYPVTTDKGLLVSNISHSLFGKTGSVMLGLVVIFACMTTAIALVGSAGSFFSTVTGNRVPYVILCLATLIFSLVVSMFGLNRIISISVPILTVVYPPALAVVFASLFSIKNDMVYRGAALGAFIISFIEVMHSFGLPFGFITSMPLSFYGFAWVLPSIILGLLATFIKAKKI